MRKTKRFAPLLSGLLIIIFLSLHAGDQLLIEFLFGQSIGLILMVILYAFAVYIIIRGFSLFNKEFDAVLDKMVHLIQTGLRRFNDV